MKISDFRPDGLHSWISWFWHPLWNLLKTYPIYMKIYDFGSDGFNTPHRGRYPISGIAPLSGRLSRYRARYRASRRYRDTSSSCCLEWSLFHDFPCFSWKAIRSPNPLRKSLRRPCIWRFFPLQENVTFGPRAAASFRNCFRYFALALRPELSCCSPWP